MRWPDQTNLLSSWTGGHPRASASSASLQTDLPRSAPTLRGTCGEVQVAALIDRVRGICHENGVELEEEVEAEAPASVKAPWWKRWLS